MKWTLRLVGLILGVAVMAQSFAHSYVDAQDDDLARIVAAYEGYAGWETYTAQSASRQQMAFTLVLGEIRLSRADSILRFYDARYDVVNETVAGKLEETRNRRFSSNNTPSASTQYTATLDVVGINQEIYVAGIVLQNTETVLETETFVTLSEVDVASPLRLFNLPSIADYEAFRDIEGFAALLRETGQILDQSTVEFDQHQGEVNVYSLILDGEEALTVLNLNMDAIFAELLASGAIDDDALKADLANNTSLTMLVFLDTETGALVAESLTLTINLRWSGSDLRDGTASDSLSIEYSYDISNIFDNINEPVNIGLSPSEPEATATPDPTAEVDE